MGKQNGNNAITHKKAGTPSNQFQELYYNVNLKHKAVQQCKLFYKIFVILYQAVTETNSVSHLCFGLENILIIN